MNQPDELGGGKAIVHLERLYHCQCAYCRQYWNLSDLEPGPRILTCPHCGGAQRALMPASETALQGDP